VLAVPGRLLRVIGGVVMSEQRNLYGRCGVGAGHGLVSIGSDRVEAQVPFLSASWHGHSTNVGARPSQPCTHVSSALIGGTPRRGKWSP
jgi:hypothetical protein